MKKLLALALTVMLLITGCGGQTPSETEQTEQTTAEPTQPGLYVPSDIEEQTHGAVRQYDLGRSGYFGITAIGDRLLLLSGTDNTQLELLSGVDCVPGERVTVPVDLREESWQMTHNGLVYYDPKANQAVFLDPQLQQTDSIQLPEDVQGKPVFAADGNELFYCVGQEIRGLDAERQLSRLIKSHSCSAQTLLGSYFDGKLIQCSVENEMGEKSTLYVSTENGGTRSTDSGIGWLATYEDRFVALRMDGVTRQLIFGNLDGEVQQLNIYQEHVEAAIALGSAVGYEADGNGNLQISYYDLAEGKKTAAVTLPQTEAPAALWADRWSGCIWMLTNADGTDSQKLLRWDVKASPVTEEATYIGPVYTQASPDEAGLGTLQDRVTALNKQHGVTIRIWQDGVKTPGSYSMEPEYQTGAIEATLNQLEQVLGLFPENFLYKSVNSKIRICIVRSIDGQSEAVRYWDDGDAFVVLPVGTDVENAFVQAAGYIVDSHILGNSPMLDTWEQLNPEGFSYGMDTQGSSDYLENDTRAFVDEVSMKSVSDDRARIFWQAMQKDNADMFGSETMQAKLLLLCQSIRDAWRLERKTESFPWEQYLSQSIAYQK